MKLYEFTYTDNQNLSEPELFLRLEDFLVTEGERQGWAPDYKFRPCQQVEQLGNGEKNYFFEVIGKYLDTDSVGFDEEASEPIATSSRPAAAAPDLNP